MASSTADLLERVRPRLRLMVEIERRRLGSKLRAYDALAAAIGRSSSWLQNLLGRQGRVGLAAETMERIAALYDSLCERLEAEAEHNRRLAAVLRGDRDAASMDVRAMDMEPGGDSGGPVRPARPVDQG